MPRMSFCALVCAGLINGLVGCGSPNSSALNSNDDAETYGPDPRLTPGLLCDRNDADFDGYRYRQNIPHCRRHVTSGDKVAIGATYGLDESKFYKYEFDHFIPLSIGGSNDAKNVWPLIKHLAREKSKFEQELFDNVSVGNLTQAQAVDMIRNWKPATQGLQQ